MVADGIISIDEIGEPARDVVAKVAAAVRALREEVGEADAEDEADPHDPNAPVSVAAIVAEMDLLTDESTEFRLRRLLGWNLTATKDGPGSAVALPSRCFTKRRDTNPFECGPQRQTTGQTRRYTSVTMAPTPTF